MLSYFITALVTVPVYSLYLLPLRFLPYYQYFRNFRRLSFARNALNVFDKLNAPQVQWISRERAEEWLCAAGLVETHLSPYCGVSWRISGIRPSTVS